QPARASLTYQLVGREELPNAVALNSSLINAGQIAGPALGGVLIATVGVGWCFAFNAATFLAVLAALLSIRVAELFPVERAKSRVTPLRGIREAASYAYRVPEIKVV